jgi:hypothetical protein
MRIKRGSHGGVTVHDKLYAVGGGNGALSYDDIECFDPNVGRWIPSTKMLERVRPVLQGALLGCKST